MTMIEIVSPSLTEYMTQVRVFASRYLGDADRWFELRMDLIADKEDQDEFSFIRMAVWEKLMESLFASPPDQANLFSQCDTTEPGMYPGSFILDGDDWARTNTLSLLTAC